MSEETMNSEEIEYMIDFKIQQASAEVYDTVNAQVEANERLIAELIPAYQELTLGLEVLVHKLWGNSIEESEDFKKKLTAARTQMLEWVSKSAKSFNVSEQDLADALGKLFPTKSADSK